MSIVPTTWNVDFALVDEREKNKMQEKLDELGALISKLRLGDGEMPRCQAKFIFKWKGKKILSLN